MASFLGLFPRPLEKKAADDWDAKFMKNMIGRDGFVADQHR
jgi:hypothetical protein